MALLWRIGCAFSCSDNRLLALRTERRRRLARINCGFNKNLSVGVSLVKDKTSPAAAPPLSHKLALKYDCDCIQSGAMMFSIDGVVVFKRLKRPSVRA